MVLLLGWTSLEPVPPPKGLTTEANIAHRAQLLRECLPEGFHVYRAGPFVVVAEADEAEGARQARWVARRSVELARVLGSTPAHLTDVWLFANTQSYRSGVRSLLGDWPRTLHGYYSPGARAVVVNLESGETTLRHELVHPYFQAFFPEAPAWVDEGYASLWEGMQETSPDLDADGPRLARLQEAILQGKLPSIAALTAGTDRDFYGDPRRLSYAQSRYVLMYLQQRELLETFLTELKKRITTDPTGFDTLLEVTGTDTAERLQEAWEHFVLNLHATR